MSLPKAPILFQLFGKVIPPQFFDELRERLGLSARGIYSQAIVVWLMMWQRLDGRGTLAMAVQQVVQDMLGDMASPDKRVREGRVSGNTGGLSRARKRLPGGIGRDYGLLSQPRQAQILCDGAESGPIGANPDK